MSINQMNWSTWTQRSTDFFLISERLSKFLKRDFTPIQDIIMQLFPNSYDRRLPRDIPIVESIAKQHAIWYRRPPTRSFSLTNGTPLSNNQVRALRTIYRGLKIDEVMKRINEQTIVQRTVTAVVLPIAGTNLLQIMTFEPFEMEVDPSPLQSSDVQACARDGEFRFRIPVRSSFDRITYGTMKISSKKAVYDYNGVEQGIWNEDGSLPAEFGGQVPIAVCRLGTPMKGDYFANLPTDVYDTQVSVGISFSDIDYRNRFDFAQKVITNATRPELEQMVMGSDRVISLMDDQKMEVLNVPSNTTEFMNAQEAFLKYVSTHNALNPAAFTAQGQATAVSKMLDLHDRDSMRQDQLMALRDCENQLYNAIRMNLNAGIKSDSWPQADVTVEYKETPLPENKLQMQQATRIAFEDGMSSPARELSRAQGISLEEAKRQIAENLEEYAAIKSAMRVSDEISG